MKGKGRVPPLKKLAALAAKILPPAWRFPICGVAASVCGLEATRPIAPDTFSMPDARMLGPIAKFLESGHPSPLALVRSHVVAIPQGIAWSRGAHLTADGRVIDSLSIGMNMPMDRWLVKRQRFFPKVQRISGPVVSLSTDGHNNYYHWMLDLLPKLFVALAAGLGNRTFYVGATTPFQKQSLTLLGVINRVDANATPFLQADEMIVPLLGPRHPPNVFDAGKCRLLAQVLAALTPRSSSLLPRRFIVSRHKTRSRRVVNEAELLTRLAPHGFQPVYAEDLTLSEQITLFANAEAIVASTGAGLVNLVHCRPGTPVAILMPEECPDFVCRDIAGFAQLRCAVFFASRHPPGTTDKIGCDITLNETLISNLVAHFKL